MKKLFACFAFLLSGMLITACQESDSGNGPDEEDYVTISLEGLMAETRAVTDYDIATFRVMFFDNNNSRGLRYNFYYPDMLTASKQVEMKVYKGNFDIVFVVNEGADTRLHNVLEGLVKGTQLSRLNTEYFSASSFSDTDHIPVAGRALDVTIIGDHSLKVGSGPVISGRWNIKQYLKRLAVRIDLTVNTEDLWVWNAFEKFTVVNLPQKVFLFDQTKSGTAIYNNDGTYSASRQFTNTEMDSYTWNTTTLKGTWSRSRIIVPSNVFATKSDESKALTIEAHLTGISALKATLGTDITSSDFTSPRNTHYTFTGELRQSSIKFSVEVEDWPTAQEIDLE